jgi:hypothetical protein
MNCAERRTVTVRYRSLTARLRVELTCGVVHSQRYGTGQGLGLIGNSNHNNVRSRGGNVGQRGTGGKIGHVTRGGTET